MAWTITPTIDAKAGIKHQIYGDHVICLKLVCTSDASSGSITLKSNMVSSATSSNYPEIMDEIAQSTLYGVYSDPGSPDAAFTVAVTDKNSLTMYSESHSNSADDYNSGAQTLGFLPPIFEQITITIGTLGNTNTANLYLYFWK